MNKQYGKLSKKNVLITGGLGFIGSNLAHSLVDIEANIMIIDSLIKDYGGNLFNINDIKDKLTVNIADIRDEASMLQLVKNQDYIFNLAGQVSHIDSMTDPYTDLEINCKSQLTILEACRKNNKNVKIIFTGTRQQYGKADYLPVDEKHLMHPTDVNGINKMAGEWYHMVYNNVYGIKACSLRLTNTYGPRQLIKHSRQGFVGWFINNIIKGEKVRIFGDGKQIRDFNYVDDVVDAMLKAAVSDVSCGNVYNLGGSEPINLIQFVELMIKTAGKGSYEIVPFPEEKKKIDIGSFYSDYNKIKKDISWTPKVSLKDGLKSTLNYYESYKDSYL